MVFRLHGPSKIALASAVVAVGLVVASDARACPLCFSGLVITPGQKLDSADQAVLALPAEDGQFRVVEVVKGEVDRDQPIANPVTTADLVGPLTSVEARSIASTDARRTDKPLLLVRNKLTEQWMSLGSLDRSYAPWLRAVAATDRGGHESPMKTWPQTAVTWSSLSDAEWRERLALVAPFLESPEPLVAELAHGELARAPYGSMRTLKPQLDAAAIAGWVVNPRLSHRRAAYFLLLGIAGGEGDADTLEGWIDAALQSDNAPDLAAMLAADLELRPDRVAWVASTFFADPARSLQEIDAARLALSVHGATDGVVPRDQVVAAYRVLIREHPPMAGFVAQDLADWEAWEVTPDYVAIVSSHAVKDPAGQFAIAGFLRDSPDARARPALDALTGAAN